MIQKRPSAARGHFDFGWLNTYHSFSFADYYDPEHMGFRSLRVINEDRVQPGKGFGTHSHRDMEIITYVLEGRLEHKDSLGNGSVIMPGDLQRMTAGTGVAHSEFNPSPTAPVHLLQIWILPNRTDLNPGYEQRPFPIHQQKNQLHLIASSDGKKGSLTVHQDVLAYAAFLEPNQALPYSLQAGRGAWIQVARGTLLLNGTELQAGDGAGVEEEPALEIKAQSPAEFLLFDLK